MKIFYIPVVVPSALMLAELAKGKLRSKMAQLRTALEGRFREHHNFLVSQILSHLDHLDELIDGSAAPLTPPESPVILPA